MTRQFRIRPYDPNRVRKPRSAAQEAATERAFKIARLRGLWYLVTVLSPSRREAVQAIIDADLRDLGAESQAIRRERERAEFDERYPPIPF
jgi:hypothetical protein